MKTILCAVSLVAMLGIGHAQVPGCYGPAPASYQAATAYLAPVIYQAAVIYQGPVTYYGPVYYNTSPCEQEYEPVSTVVVIGGGRSYSYANRPTVAGLNWGSTVTCIGSRYARPSFRRGGYQAHGFKSAGASHGRSGMAGRGPGRRR